MQWISNFCYFGIDVFVNIGNIFGKLLNLTKKDFEF